MVDELKRTKKITGAQSVYASLKRSIVSLDLAPGTELDERDIVSEFHVSRTPVREALIRLNSDGLVEIHPNKGASVATLTFADITDHLETMDILIPSAAFLCALRRTSNDLDNLSSAVVQFNRTINEDSVSDKVDAILRFHTTLATATHNASLKKMYVNTLNAKLRISRLGLSPRSPDDVNDLDKHHQRLVEVYGNLYDCIERRDSTGAQQAGAEHVCCVRARLTDLLAKSPSEKIKVSFPAA